MKIETPDIVLNEGLPTEQVKDFADGSNSIPFDSQQIAIVGSQILPQNKQAVLEAYNDAIKTLYGYLVVHITAHSDDKFRLKTCFFPK